MEYLGGQHSQIRGPSTAVTPSIALERLATLEQRIGNLVGKLAPIITDRPQVADNKPQMPIENQLLTMINRQIEAIESITRSIDL